MRMLVGSGRFFRSSAMLSVVASMYPDRVRFFPWKSFAGVGFDKDQLVLVPKN